MRPVRRVRMVTMWSASPRSWVRSTIPSSRYCPTRPLSLTRRTEAPGQLPYRPRARLTADSTARRDAVTVLVSTPTPHPVWPPTSHSTYAAAWASLPAERVLGVVNHPHVDPERAQRVAERGD